MVLLSARTVHTLFEILFFNICFYYSNLMVTLFRIDYWVLFRSSNLVPNFINSWKWCLVFNSFLTKSPIFNAHSKSTIFSLCKYNWTAPGLIIVIMYSFARNSFICFLSASLETESLYKGLHPFLAKFSFPRPSQGTDPQVFLMHHLFDN